MKFHVDRWLGYGLALITFMLITVPVYRVGARQTNPVNDSVIQPVRQQRNRAGASIEQVTSIPNQGYTNYVTGTHSLYSLPGTVKGTRLLYNQRTMRNLADRQILFMVYRKAVTSRGSIYYKIVSQHHSVRGWTYQNALLSILNRRQQAANLKFGSQITQAEMVADQSKHESILNRTNVNLKPARRFIRKAGATVQILKGTPNYSMAKATLRAGQRYLDRIRLVNPSQKTIQGIETIRSEYNQASQAVADAQSASLNHQMAQANRDIKSANRSLRRVSRILGQIHNRHDRRVAMALFNHALNYVNANYSFNPEMVLNGRNLKSRSLSSVGTVALIKSYETDAQNAIMNLYPNLDNFDVALTDAYRAQNDLNQAHDLVASLKGTHLRRAELSDIQNNQHNINALWNV